MNKLMYTKRVLLPLVGILVGTAVLLDLILAILSRAG